MDNPHSGHRKRLKQEFRDIGLEHFPDHKVMELLLFYANPRKDTNPLAHQLLERFGSLSGIMDAPIELLAETQGMGQESATFLKIIAQFTRRYLNDAYSSNGVIKSFDDAKEYMRYRFVGDQVERVLLVCMGPGGKIVYSGQLATGTLEKVDIPPATVVKTCLRVNAVQAILAHNHPGGFCIPSGKDVRTTAILHQELHRVEVELFDHIIVATDGVYSMQEGGMFPQTTGIFPYVDKI